MHTNLPQPPDMTIKRGRFVRFLFTLIVLGLAIHLLLPQIATLPHSLQVIRNMITWALVLAVVGQIASYLGSGFLLKALIRQSGGSLTVWSGMIMTLAGTSFGLVAGGAAGSGAAIFHWMQKRNVNRGAATLAGIVPMMFNDSILVLVSLFGLIHLLTAHELSLWQGISFILVLAILLSVISLMVWGFRNREALKRLAQRIGSLKARLGRRSYHPQKTQEWLDGLLNAADGLLAGGFSRPLWGAVMNVGFDLLTLYFLFIAAGHRVSVGLLLTGYGLPLLLGKMAFILPGGIGVVESSMAVLYAGLGVPNSVTVVVVLAYRILSFWLPFLFGLPLFLILQRKSN